MAEGTRLRDLSEHLTNLEGRFQQLSTECHQRIGGLTTQLAEVREAGQKHYEALQLEAVTRHEQVLKDSADKHEELRQLIIAQLQSQQSEPSKSPTRPRGGVGNTGNGDFRAHNRDAQDRGILPKPYLRDEGEGEGFLHNKGFRPLTTPHHPYPKLEFPSFDGTEPRIWLENCKQYFDFYQIPHAQWLGVATMHLTGRAKTWKQGFFINRQGITWEGFTEALCRRFAITDERYLIREFRGLKQWGTVEQYQEKFEDLRSQLLYYNSYLTEEYFIASYLSGLKEELMAFMDLAHPGTLEETYEQARLHEKAVAVLTKKSKFASRGTPGQGFQSLGAKATSEGQVNKTMEPGRATHDGQTKRGTTQQQEARQLREQRRLAGQCYRCGNKYYAGHTFPDKTLNALHGSEEVIEIFDED